jgi:hypothetical protein
MHYGSNRLSLAQLAKFLVVEFILFQMLYLLYLYLIIFLWYTSFICLKGDCLCVYEYLCLFLDGVMQPVDEQHYRVYGPIPDGSYDEAEGNEASGKPRHRH